jgi:arylsulfatase A-like enzyme
MTATIAAAHRPNIVLIVMDSVRASNLSCYGYHRPTTPQLDALAAESTLFMQAISVGCWTLPVHASLFTGLYPFNHGVNVSRDALPADCPTLAGQLQQHGYRTACFSNNPYISRATGLAAGFDVAEELWTLTRSRGHQRTRMGRLIKRLEGLGPAARPAIAVARSLQRARSVVKRRRPQRDSGASATNARIARWLSEARKDQRPFFLFANYMECHEPYNPPRPFDRKFMPARYTPWHVARVGNNKDVQSLASDEQRRERLEIIQALYDGELNYLDSQLGALVEEFKRQGVLDNTLFIVTADHGDSLGEHGQVGHRLALYEQLVHVPLLIRLPGRFAAGARDARQVQLIDLHATMLEAAGLPAASGTGSVSLLSGTPRAVAIAENTAPKSLDNVVARMVRTDRYKYIWKSNQQHELYDLVNDPQESINLVEQEQAVAAHLAGELHSWQQSLSKQTIAVAEAEYDEAVLARLRDLGYVD